MLQINVKSALPNGVIWGQVNWNHAKRYVEKLQQRIFRAERLGQKRKLRNLQRTMVKSKANLLLSIKRVTQSNKGKKTPGIDGETALSDKKRADLYKEMLKLNIADHKPKPSYRTYIKKKNGKLRPLSIPTIRDRTYQSVIKNALEPQWEARFEPTSYGFRPKRNCHDAVARIFKACYSGRKRWIFEGDFKGCFDNLNHEYIMSELREFPYSRLIRRWLGAGYVDNGVFHETGSGSGQGSIVSPLLANIALRGMEDTLNIKHKAVRQNGKIIGYQIKGKYTLIFYADDFVIICKTREDAEKVPELISGYLSKRGLQLSEEKTKISNIKEGFDFLGLNVRMYLTSQGEKLLIKPSVASQKKARETITKETKQLQGTNVNTQISKLNPIITGTGNYWSPWVAKKVYQKMDYHTWRRIYLFLRKLHPKKSYKWIKKRYFKADITGQSRDRWILTDPHENKQLTRMSWIPIIRHYAVWHDASPYNADLKKYFEKRDIREFNRNSIKSKQKLAKRQNYKCPICNMGISDYSEKLTVKEKVPTEMGEKREFNNLELVHQSCGRRYYKRFPTDQEIPDKKIFREFCKETRRLRWAEMS